MNNHKFYFFASVIVITLLFVFWPDRVLSTKAQFQLEPTPVPAS